LDFIFNQRKSAAMSSSSSQPLGAAGGVAWGLATSSGGAVELGAIAG